MLPVCRLIPVASEAFRLSPEAFPPIPAGAVVFCVLRLNICLTALGVNMATASKDLKEKLQIAAEVLERNGPESLFAVLYNDWDESAEGTSSARKGATRESKKSTFTKQFKGDSKSTQDVDLFERLGLELGLKEPGLTLMECSARDFVKKISASGQRLLKDRARIPGHEWLAALFSEEEDEIEETDQVIYRSLTHNFADKADAWQESGQVDQKFMYLNLNSVENWRSVISDGSYKNYPRCKATLADLLETPDWCREASSISTLVIFGAGTPEKEILVIKDLLKQSRFSAQNKLRVVMVDASVYMLVDTYVQIRKDLERDHHDKCVEIVQCWADFLHMQPHLRRIRRNPGQGRVAFFLMGGTIGNIDEGRFLSSVFAVSEPNDILVVSAEFISEANDRDQYIAELQGHYSGDGARDLVLEPIRRLLDAKGISGERTDRRNMIKPTVFYKNPILGPIQGTVGVVMKFEHRLLKLNLSQSKRYESKHFKAFFEGLSFQLISDLPCKDYAPYRQLMFVRKDE